MSQVNQRSEQIKLEMEFERHIQDAARRGAAHPSAAEGLAEETRDPLDPARGIGNAIILAIILVLLACALVNLFSEWVSAGGWLR